MDLETRVAKLEMQTAAQNSLIDNLILAFRLMGIIAHMKVTKLSDIYEVLSGDEQTLGTFDQRDVLAALPMLYDLYPQLKDMPW